ncbi:BTB/POZ protein [Glomus cerebriforme]|uniref:BTB/POZ protein n=1 Tax=Glomus cerebriforme TaxID=658196 RepID=A0A397T7B3_9GLOM|nr:BTB/POZ protein [Glomus cerebriforme]
MTRGYSLEQDLKLLINNPKYSDIEILCEDEKKLHGSRAILAARSEVFEALLYNGMKESYENQISFPKINSSGMEIILEYIYTGSIKEEILTKYNIIETYHAANYFQLSNLQDFIIKTVKNALEKDYLENYSPELLSKVVDIMSLSEDNVILNLLVEAVAIIPLSTIEFDRLSIAALQYLLTCTHEKEKPFATPEYEVFRYSAILAAKQVSNDAYKILNEQLPILEQVENSIQVKNELFTDHQKVAKELEPLTKFIDFNKIKGQILTDIIEPLEIVPSKIILDVYRKIAKSNSLDSCGFRGIPRTILYNNLFLSIYYYKEDKRVLAYPKKNLKAFY